jgi:hypothetical protein
MALDPVLFAVAGKVAGFLRDFLMEETEDLRKRIGVSAVDKLTDLLKSLRRRWAGDAEATQALNKFEGNPSAHQAELEKVIASRMEKDPAFAADLQARSDDISIVVEQEARKAGTMRGAQFGNVKSGDITHKQKADEVDDMVGPTFKDVGD